MPQPYSFAGEHSTAYQCIAVHGVSEREKLTDDIRQTCEPEIQIWEPAHLVRGYYVDTVGANKEAVADCIRKQLDEDVITDQISFKEYMDPFTGSKNPKA